MKKLVKIYEKQKVGELPVSVWVDANANRSFDEAVIGIGIDQQNINSRRFDHKVAVCHCLKDFNNALKEFEINNFKNTSAYKSYKSYLQF